MLISESKNDNYLQIRSPGELFNYWEYSATNTIGEEVEKCSQEFVKFYYQKFPIISSPVGSPRGSDCEESPRILPLSPMPPRQCKFFGDE